MPLVYPASVIAEMKKLGGAFGDIALLDIEARDGTRYYLTDVGGSYPSAFDGSTQVYKPWTKSAGPLRMTSDFRTDAGDITLQNLSGNTIDREVAKIINDREFENSLAIFRLWLPLADYAIREHHGTLTDQRGDYEECAFRLAQLFDTNQFYVAEDSYAALCSWFYGGHRCGSVTGHASCNKTIPDCVARNARERNNSTPTPPPNYLYTQPIGGPSPGGIGGAFAGFFGCTKKGTLLEPLNGPIHVREEPWEDWVELVLVDGTRLDGVPEHPVYTDRGKTWLINLLDGEEVVTKRGMVPVRFTRQYKEPGIKLVASVPQGLLYWATSPATPQNAVLSHNKLNANVDVLQ
ncbi:MAG: hypothetical protein JWN45_1810 [Acidobacteriaceae bacterium]|nr:hypothetical protein [Acidobacteriaceae bacterium]